VEKVFLFRATTLLREEEDDACSHASDAIVARVLVVVVVAVAVAAAVAVFAVVSLAFAPFARRKKKKKKKKKKRKRRRIRTQPLRAGFVSNEQNFTTREKKGRKRGRNETEDDTFYHKER
jgi:flagellar biosynthesis/type III secretory pathway M-ring protein FliF/YscJ